MQSSEIVHQGPYCELRFSYMAEVKDHVLRDHPGPCRQLRGSLFALVRLRDDDNGARSVVHDLGGD